MTREEKLGIIIDGIENLDNVAMETARKKWNSIAKPLHSLGKLEEHIIRIAGITGNAEVELKNRALIAMCADNGVVEEGVTQTGHPGPEINSTCFGRSLRIPRRKISCVCVPHTSMIRTAGPSYPSMISLAVFFPSLITEVPPSTDLSHCHLHR